MPFQAAMRQAMGLVSHMESLAALGTYLGEASQPVHPEVAKAIEPVIDHLRREMFEDLTPAEAATIRAFIRSFFRQSADLLDNPGRAPGWAYDDPLITNNIGRGSQVIIKAIADYASRSAALAERLSRPARFLDVGSGTGWICLAAAERWPTLHADGIDIFDLALELAAQNLAQSAVADRVAFTKQDVTELDADGRYAMSFFAGPFIAPDSVPTGLERLHRAIEPGGWLFFGLMQANPLPLHQALLELRVIRSGGYPWTDREVVALLDAAGFEADPEVLVELPARLIAARRRR